MEPAPVHSELFESLGGRNFISRVWHRWFNEVAEKGWVDRGDPATYDFTVSNFTTDETWRDLDLSGIIPTGENGARFVLLQIQIYDDAVGSIFGVRKKGRSNTANVAVARTQVANNYIDHQVVVACDMDGYIQYYGTNTTFTYINVLVHAWYL